MSGDKIAVELQERTVIRKGLTGLRQEGMVPAVIHNHGKESLLVMGDYVKLTKVYSQAGKHHPVEVIVGGKQHLALIKDVDYEPAKHRLRHVVFQAIKQNEEVEAEIPVVFKEYTEIPAEKASLLVLKQLDHVEVKAFPRDLPDQLVVDPSSLNEVGDTLSVADLVVPFGVTVLTEPDTNIAIVEMPRDQLAEANAAAAEQAAADAGVGEASEAVEATGDESSEEA